MDSSEWDSRYRSADRLWSAGPNLFVADRLGSATPGKGLDLASGEGRNAIWLSRLGWEMTAVDFSQVAVDRGRSVSQDVEFVWADVVDWEPAESCDLVLIAYLHLPPEVMERVVKRSATWLNPGGEVFMIGHDRSNLDEGYGGPQIPEILWDVDLIKGWLGGMRLIEAQVVRRPVETDDGVVYARDALVRARPR